MGIAYYFHNFLQIKTAILKTCANRTTSGQPLIHPTNMTEITQIKLSKSNCYLVRGDKRILVDTGSPNESGRIIEALEKVRVSLSDISLILHTHGHADHCGSTTELLAICKIPTAIHIADGHMALKGISDPTINIRLMSKILKPFVSKPFPPFKADFLIDNNFDLKEFGVNGQIYSTPGHTNGSISITFDNKKAIIGDLLMGGYFGGMFFPHLPDYHYFETNPDNVNRSLEKMLLLDVFEYYVGHGGPLTKERIIKWFEKNPNR